MADIQRISLDEVTRQFHELEDPRSTVNRQHPLVSVVVIALRGYPITFSCNSRYLNGFDGLVASGFKNMSMR